MKNCRFMVYLVAASFGFEFDDRILPRERQYGWQKSPSDVVESSYQQQIHIDHLSLWDFKSRCLLHCGRSESVHYRFLKESISKKLSQSLKESRDFLSVLEPSLEVMYHSLHCQSTTHYVNGKGWRAAILPSSCRTTLQILGHGF